MPPSHSTNPSKGAAVELALDLFDYLVFNDHRLPKGFTISRKKGVRQLPSDDNCMRRFGGCIVVLSGLVDLDIICTRGRLPGLHEDHPRFAYAPLG